MPKMHNSPSLGSSGILAPIKSLFATLSRQVRAIAESIVKSKTIKEAATKPKPNHSNVEHLTSVLQSKLPWLDAIDACQHGDDDFGLDAPSVLNARTARRYAAHSRRCCVFLVATAQCKSCQAQLTSLPPVARFP